MKTPVLLTAALLAGCASMSPSERAWQVLHVVDVAQTLNGPASDRCFREREPVTRAVIGDHPEPGAVVAWGLGVAVLHHVAFRWIESRDWPDGLKVALRSVATMRRASGRGVAMSRALRRLSECRTRGR